MTTETVVIHCARPPDFLLSHEGCTLGSIAQALARLKGCAFAGTYNEATAYPGPLFFLPDETLVQEVAVPLGITSLDQLFGGIVPRAFVRTKVITHPIIGAGADQPRGWSEQFGAAVSGVVLPGWTVFTARDARAAAERLLPRGAIRAKRPLAAGGRGQTVLPTTRELEDLLAEISAHELSEHGLVLELDLTSVTTASVGHVMVGDLTVTYHGRQTLTTDNDGRSVYGGSDLVCVRGSWPAMDRFDLEPADRLAIRQARAYDEASANYYGVMASRRNYDIAQGFDESGRWWSGVLESSWRVGGASGAEVAALEAFASDPTLAVVRASCREAYGDDLEPPAGARVHFRGVDTNAGRMLRYALVAPGSRRKAA